ncbi:MAG: GatB/YqeY domain-containing protein [Pseudomonadota bacterium]
MLRDDLKAAQIAAMKGGDKPRTTAIRQIMAKIKDQDIAMRTSDGKGDSGGDDDAMVVDVLRKMAKQRRESIAMYRHGGRDELADAEENELTVIEEFLPAQMDEEATRAAIEAIKAETGAEGMKDMGKVMGLLKQRHGSQLDMGKASALVKAVLG